MKTYSCSPRLLHITELSVLRMTSLPLFFQFAGKPKCLPVALDTLMTQQYQRHTYGIKLQILYITIRLQTKAPYYVLWITINMTSIY